MSKLLVLILFLLTNYSITAQIYVRSGSTGDGTSWSNAMGTLAEALNQAANNSEIWVAEGTYYPHTCLICSEEERDLSFNIPDGVALFGGFAGFETAISQRNIDTNPTILSGDIDEDGSFQNNSFSVVMTNNVGNTTIIDGFTITMGNANGAEGSLEVSRRSGGGWYNGSIANSTSSPLIRNCTFTRNRAESFGGGMYNFGSFSGNSSPTYVNCLFSNNRTGFDGGAIYNNGSFEGFSRPVFINCIFRNNLAGTNIGSGGAIYNNGIEGESSPIILNSSFSINIASLHGGAIYNQGKQGNSSPKLVNCIFYQNNASLGGCIYNLGVETGGQSSPTITNCTFFDNYAENGAAILNNGALMGNSSPEVSNCIFWNNRATDGETFFNIFGTPHIEYSLVETADCESLNSHVNETTSRVICGEGMIYNILPKFVNEGSADLHLNYNSPLIDKGNAAIIADTPLDMEGNPRVHLRTVDLGAFEYQGPLPTQMDSFQLIKEEDFIRLSWTTLNEYQNFGFRVLRSLDGVDFQTIEVIESQGDSDTPQFYQYDDTALEPGFTHTYQIQRLDNDGCYEFSRADSIFIEVVKTEVLLQPNPADNAATILLTLEEPALIRVHLTDIYGRIEDVFEAELPRGQQTIPLDISSRGVGVHYVWVFLGHFPAFSLPLVIVRS